MKYIKATTILPEELLVEIQKYVQGETIYIPKQKCTYEKGDLFQAEERKSMKETLL